MSAPPLTADAPLRVGSHVLQSRLIVGTGKYASYEQMAEALELSGADCITVAVRRERLTDRSGRKHSRLHRPATVFAAAEHRRLFHSRGCGARRATGARDSQRARQSRR